MRGLAAHDGTAEVVELLHLQQRGVMRRNAAMLWGKTEDKRHVEFRQRTHLPVELCQRIRSEIVSP